MSAAARIAFRRHLDAVQGCLTELFPRAFPGGRQVPALKIGIHLDLLALVKPAIDAGTLTERDLRITLARYTTSGPYLFATSKAGAPRICINHSLNIDTAHERNLLGVIGVLACPATCSPGS